MKIRNNILTAVMVAAGVLSALPLSAHAFGFGSIRALSEIGQPLRAEVDINLASNELAVDIGIRQAGVHEYTRQAIPFTSALADLSVVIQSRAGKSIAVITSKAPINEPILQLILEGESAQGRMFRAFALSLQTSALNGGPAADTAVESKAITAADIAALRGSEFGRQNKNYDEAKGVFKDEATKPYASLIEIGVRPAGQVLARVKGAGKGVAIKSVLPKIVPVGWKGFAGDASMGKEALIEWVGGNRYWITVLNEVLGEAQMTATIDWARKEVTFLALDPAPAIKTVVQTNTPDLTQAARVQLDVENAVKERKLVHEAAAKAQAESQREAAELIAREKVQQEQQRLTMAQEAAEKQAEHEAVLERARVQRVAAEQEAAAQMQEPVARAQAASLAEQVLATRAYASLTEIGERQPGKLMMRVKGDGKNVAIKSVLPKVVPKQWKGFAGDGSLQKEKMVDWSGGDRFWITVLDELLSSSQMTAVIDWNRKEVTFHEIEVQAQAVAKAVAARESAQLQADAARAANEVKRTLEERQAAQLQEQKRAEALALADRLSNQAIQKQAFLDTARAQAELEREVKAQKELRKQASIEEARKQAQERRVQVAQKAAAAAQAKVDAKAAQDAQIAAKKQAELDTARAQADLERDIRAQKVAKAREDAQLVAQEQAHQEQVRAQAESNRVARENQMLAAAAAIAYSDRVQVKGDVAPEVFYLNSNGIGVGLFNAVQQMLPPGWAVFTKDRSLEQVENVFWNSDGRQWLLVIDDVLLQSGVRASVDTAKKEVRLIR